MQQSYHSAVMRPNFTSHLGKPFSIPSHTIHLISQSRDIDLVITSESMAYSDKVNVLHAVASSIRKAGIADKVTIIAKAKVPIVKFVTTHGRFSVDISINQLNGVAAGKMVNRYLGELPALRPLVLVVKSFLSQRSMNEVFTGGLGSYSIVCLCISFLQQHPKIRRGEIDPSKNLGVLVMEFFELYGVHFNYQDVGISLRDGGTYFNKSSRGWSDFRNSGLLSIEDPADMCELLHRLSIKS
jgi:non-canonical poly(A) RNA polymerase PAPD5/7